MRRNPYVGGVPRLPKPDAFGFRSVNEMNPADKLGDGSESGRPRPSQVAPVIGATAPKPYVGAPTGDAQGNDRPWAGGATPPAGTPWAGGSRPGAQNQAPGSAPAYHGAGRPIKSVGGNAPPWLSMAAQSGAAQGMAPGSAPAVHQGGAAPPTPVGAPAPNTAPNPSLDKARAAAQAAAARAAAGIMPGSRFLPQSMTPVGAKPGPGPVPETMTPPVAPPPVAPIAPTPIPSVGGTMQPFGPGNDLRATQINPGDSEDQSAFRDMRMDAATNLTSGPSRAEIAQQRLEAFDTEAQPQIRDQQRAVAQRAAALGRVGMGDTGVEVLRPFTDYLTQRKAMETRLAADTAEGEIGDRFNVLDSTRNLYGDEEIIGRGRRNEYRGERDYQQDMSQTDIDNTFRGRQQEQSEYQAEIDRSIRELALSMGMDPTIALEMAARNSRGRGNY